jgi:hypothetical protein
MPVLLSEEKMREKVVPYLQDGEEISIVSFASHKGFWKSSAFIFTLTNKRILVLEIGWTSHKKIKSEKEFPLDAEFSYGMKRGSTGSVTPGEMAAKGIRMNTLFLVMPDGSKEYFTFQDSDKDIPARVSEFLAKLGKTEST